MKIGQSNYLVFVLRRSKLTKTALKSVKHNETIKLTVSPEQRSYIQWRITTGIKTSKTLLRGEGRTLPLSIHSSHICVLENVHSTSASS